MTAHYRMSIASIDLTIPQGVTFEQRWGFNFDDGDGTTSPFPFFSDPSTPIWTGRCMIREFPEDTSPLVTLTTENNGVALDNTDVDGVVTETFYSIFLTATQTAALTPGKLYYDLEFIRTSDGWVIKPQRGRVTVIPEITK